MTPPIKEGENTYWWEGIPSDGLRNPNTPTGKQIYWMNGIPEENLFTLSNQDTGKFFLLFD